MTTVFHFLRHASHAHLGKILTGRQAGVPLSSKGREEAKALGKHMAGLGVDAIYSSPRLRARATAEIVAREIGIAHEIAEELDEIDFGHWSGRSFEGLAPEPAWQRWNAERDIACTPAGETMSAVATRVMRLIERARLNCPGSQIALVSHSDVIKAGLCHYFGLPFGRMHEVEIDPGSVTTLEVRDGGGRVIACNLRPALLDAGVLA